MSATDDFISDMLHESTQRFDAEPVAPELPAAVEPQEPEPSWATTPRFQRALLLDGEEVVFYTISAFAFALGRTPGTVRAWEKRGVIPDAPFRAGSDSPRGERRLYTREVIEQVRELADSLGMIEFKTLPIPDEFTTGVVAIFQAAVDDD